MILLILGIAMMMTKFHHRVTKIDYDDLDRIMYADTLLRSLGLELL